MKIYSLSVSFILLLVLTGCSYNQKNDTGGSIIGGIKENIKEVSKTNKDSEEVFILERVSVDTFAKAMENKDTILIDIRTPEELKETGILSTNAINIDFYSENYENELLKLDKNAKYLIYCRSGNRSGKTLEIMKRLGFKNVLDLEKGIVSWKESGMKLYTWEESNKEQSEKMRIITVDAQKFAFSPNEIRVKKGENVALFINDIGSRVV